LGWRSRPQKIFCSHVILFEDSKGYYLCIEGDSYFSSTYLVLLEGGDKK